MSKLASAYMDVVTVGSHNRKGGTWRPARYTAVAAKKDGHMYWKFVGWCGQGSCDLIQAEVRAQAAAKELGLKYKNNVKHNQWVDFPAFMEKKHAISCGYEEAVILNLIPGPAGGLHL